MKSYLKVHCYDNSIGELDVNSPADIIWYLQQPEIMKVLGMFMQFTESDDSRIPYDFEELKKQYSFNFPDKF